MARAHRKGAIETDHLGSSLNFERTTEWRAHIAKVRLKQLAGLFIRKFLHFVEWRAHIAKVRLKREITGPEKATPDSGMARAHRKGAIET